MWWSAKPRPMRFTVVTQMSVDRLPMLAGHCNSFAGVVSAAMYLPLVQDGDGRQLSAENAALVAQAVKELDAAHAA